MSNDNIDVDVIEEMIEHNTTFLLYSLREDKPLDYPCDFETVQERNFYKYIYAICKFFPKYIKVLDQVYEDVNNEQN